VVVLLLLLMMMIEELALCVGAVGPYLARSHP
jgi:hypothetical protein